MELQRRNALMKAIPVSPFVLTTETRPELRNEAPAFAERHAQVRGCVPLPLPLFTIIWAPVYHHSGTYVVQSRPFIDLQPTPYLP